ncbi:ectonucleotide pyrophosphatase/phosphodiesterase family member 6-like protein, partial [Dinothrombium tinctorium]
MIMNNMYDPKINDFFSSSPHATHWWTKAEPIWTLAENSGVRTAVYYWDGCQVEINDVIPTRCLMYRPIRNWDAVNEETEASLEQILNGFSRNKFSLSLLYYEPIDHYGHKYGPNSNETFEA